MKSLITTVLLLSAIFTSAQVRLRVDNEGPDYIRVVLLAHSNQYVDVAPHSSVNNAFSLASLDPHELFQVWWAVTKTRLDSVKRSAWRTLAYDLVNPAKGDWVLYLKRDAVNRKWLVNLTPGVQRREWKHLGYVLH